MEIVIRDQTLTTDKAERQLRYRVTAADAAFFKAHPWLVTADCWDDM